MLVDAARTAGASANGDGIAGDGRAAVQVEDETAPAVLGDARPGTLDVANGTELQVARLEDVLRVDDRPDVLPRRAPSTHSVAPPSRDPVERPTDLDDAALERAKRELTRLEQLLRVSPGPDDDPAPTAPVQEAHGPKALEAQPRALRYVAAHRLRSAFLFEQTAAFEQGLALQADEDVEELVAPVPEPVSTATVEPVLPEPDPQAGVSSNGSQLWLGAMCLMALIALVVALTGRRSHRCRCA